MTDPVAWMAHRMAGRLPTGPWLAPDVDDDLPLAGWLEPLPLRGVEPTRIGVYVATADVGVRQAACLWGEALVHGPAFTNPRPFPWTLASSVGAQCAAELGAMGPNLTLVGGAEAALAAVAHAVGDLLSSRVDRALVLAADGWTADGGDGEPGWPPPRAVAVVLAPAGSPGATGELELITVGGATAAASGDGAAVWLGRACEAVDLSRGQDLPCGAAGGLRIGPALDGRDSR